ncbi:MAG TPA: nuclear transport factor 2 family protein [Gemmatimonadaceae bacterium]|nr:nuclear transport factor 2 family protein [Gemmatimonadaceae bacterium]
MPNDPAELTTTWFDAWRTKDVAAVERMIAADYVYVAPNGAELKRDAILAIIKDPSYGIVAGAHSDVAVLQLGSDVTLVRHRWRGHGTIGGRVFVDDHQCVMVWFRTEGRWCVQYEQASPVDQ